MSGASEPATGGRWTKKCSEVRVDGDARDDRGAPRARSSRESPRGRARRAWIVAMFDPDGFRTRARASRSRARASLEPPRRLTFWRARGGKRGGAPRVHLQLLHAAVVSLIVETTFARHNSAGGSGRDGGQKTRGTRDLPAARRARTHHREKKTRQDCGSRRRWRDRPEHGATAGRDAARNAPSPGGVRAKHPRDGVNASGTRCALPTRLARSPAHSSAT